MSDDVYEVRKEDLAGFELFGCRDGDGQIHLGHTGQTVLMPEFPEEVRLLGAVWTLEGVRENEVAFRYPDDDPRRRICWGEYA